MASSEELTMAESSATCDQSRSALVSATGGWPTATPPCWPVHLVQEILSSRGGRNQERLAFPDYLFHRTSRSRTRVWARNYGFTWILSFGPVALNFHIATRRQAGARRGGVVILS